MQELKEEEKQRQEAQNAEKNVRKSLEDDHTNWKTLKIDFELVINFTF
jgi:hypothetical protein